MRRWAALLLALLVLAGCAADGNLRGGEAVEELTAVEEMMEDAIDASKESHPGAEGGEAPAEGAAEGENEFVVTASDVKDATAHAVDQTLVGKAEEELAEKESQDPLLADPLLSLEKEHEDDDKVDAEIEKLDESMEEEEERLFYDPKLFSKDTVAEMDTNNDGFLDEDELIAHLTKAIDKVRQDELLKQKEVNAEGVKEIMEMMDENKDGKLSKEEMFGKTTQTSKQRIADNRMFDFADGAFGNKDGELDEDEIFIMALPQYSEDREAWYKFKAHDHMEEMDTDGDNKITWKEYQDAMDMATAEEVAPGFVADEPEQGGLNHLQKKQLFDQADSNHDKMLDIDELAGMVKALEKRNMKDTIDDLIKLADDNKDHKLALSEIIKHVDDFGGHVAFFLNDPELLFPSNKFKLKDNTKDPNKLVKAPTRYFVTKAIGNTVLRHEAVHITDPQAAPSKAVGRR